MRHLQTSSVTAVGRRNIFYTNITRPEQTACKFQLTLRLLMSYIYGAPILDVSRSHTTRQHSR